VDARIVARDQDHCVAIWERVVIQIWYGETRVPAVQAMSRACEDLLRTAQGDVSTVALIEASAPAPDHAGRKALADWSGRVAARFARAAVIAEGGGFRSSLVRGVGLAFTTLTPHRLPFKFFATVADAATYLGPSLSQPQAGPRDLETAISALRVEGPVGAATQR
jgi:hypothetical protein